MKFMFKTMPSIWPALACIMSATGGALGSDLVRAREIYNQICFSCHGPAFDGGKGPSLKDGYWRHGDSPEAILKVINKGVPGSEMLAFEEVLPESDRLALRDLVLGLHEGLRGVERLIYPRAPFVGKRLEPALFESIKPSEQKPLPENVFYLDRNQDGVLRGRSKLHIKEAGRYQFQIRPVGRTSIFLNGEEVHYSDEKTSKTTHVNRVLELDPGIHELEVLHEERTTHSMRFHGVLKQVGGSRQFALTGRSLEGSVPKVIVAEPEAKVVRKWIAGLPFRTLLCLLPNRVLVAYNPESGSVLQAWHSAEVNQTPSLVDRSAKPSEIRGTPIADIGAQVLQAEHQRFLRYEMRLDTVHLVTLADGVERTVTISPDGDRSFKVAVQ